MISQVIGVDAPGPGSYTPCEGSTSNRYKNTYNYQLHKYDRKIELYDKTKLNLPGPQHYILPSDFGNSHLASSTGFSIPQLNAGVGLTAAKTTRTRNNAILPRTKSTNLGTHPPHLGSISQ